MFCESICFRAPRRNLTHWHIFLPSASLTLDGPEGFELYPCFINSKGKTIYQYVSSDNGCVYFYISAHPFLILNTCSQEATERKKLIFFPFSRTEHADRLLKQAWIGTCKTYKKCSSCMMRYQEYGHLYRCALINK